MKTIWLIIGAICFFSSAGAHAAEQEVPANATASPFGNSWQCNRGFRKDFNTNSCIKVTVPENAKLDITGSNWICNRGFKKDRILKSCERVVVPENAALDITGHSWRCNRGFRKNETFDGCSAVVVPANAELDITGQQWKCKKGYKRDQSMSECVAVVVPENAQLNFIGNGWECLAGYKRSSGACLKMTAEEFATQKAFEERIAAELEKRRQYTLADGDCETEYKTGAEVCVTISDGDFECDESYLGGYFDECEVEISYDIATNYQGGSYIDANVSCEVEIDYIKGGYGFSSSDSDSDVASHSLYAGGNDSETMEFSFSFSSFDEVQSAKISDASCEISDVNMW